MLTHFIDMVPRGRGHRQEGSVFIILFTCMTFSLHPLLWSARPQCAVKGPPTWATLGRLKTCRVSRPLRSADKNLHLTRSPGWFLCAWKYIGHPPKSRLCPADGETGHWSLSVFSCLLSSLSSKTFTIENEPSSASQNKTTEKKPTFVYPLQFTTHFHNQIHLMFTVSLRGRQVLEFIL